ncbi:laccase-like [Pieris napi]|uniref:laccase-like n=1 Tax=Pieris napi TaxID=78633 RepID=UPI001FBA26E0|nr:laccase-like [Pieris napi]XP_047510343.1 laccase-like [Pieris napi]XP_047510344.1 laccase-like [Pieris napi]
MAYTLARNIVLLALAASVYSKDFVVQSPVEVTTDTIEATTDHVLNTRNESTDKSTEEPNIKVLDNTPKPLESASKVLLPIISNDSFNDLKYQVKRRNNTIVPPRTVEVPKKPIRQILKNEYKTHVQYDEVTGELISGEHPCQRDCVEGGEPMICYYHFSLELYMTMSKACFDCPYNETDCDRIDCIPADGISRPLTVINRRMPGPAIEVCQNDRIIVDVENDLMTEGTTVHWHGQHQRGTNYMDGTPYITQCPILPETTFRYQFNATQAGTHFWHSHSGMQRADGAAGPFIIRKPKSQEPHGVLYDYDRADHVMLITDWIHDLSLAMFSDHHHSLGDNKPPTLLVNGVGRFKIFNDTNTTKPKYMKTARFNVEQGYKYRFRVINAEFLNCPIEMSVDGHNITIIASDGYDLVPITATSLVTYAGERFDFVLETNNEIDNYWIRFRGLMDCDERFTKAKQVAVLHYEGAMEVEPSGDPTWEELHNEGLQLNALNKGEEDEETISVAEMRSLEGYDDSLKEVADYQFYIAYDFYPKNNSHYHRSPYYGYYQVPNPDNRLYTPQLNHISMKMPSSPLMISRPSADNFCNASSIDESCKEGYCECSHVLSVKKNAVVELIIVDEGVTFDANHPFHLHGYYFRVVGMRRLAEEITVDEIKAYDKAGLMKRNLKNPPLKDTVTVPDGGYTILRFKADNPGYWLFHCHIEFHVEVGMALVFKVGEEKDFPPIPRDFPRCGNYMPDNMVEHETTPKPSNDNQFISITHWWPVVYVNNTSGAVKITSSVYAILCIWTLRILLRYI